MSLAICSCTTSGQREQAPQLLGIKVNEDGTELSVLRVGEEQPLLVQHAPGGVRPYIHPLVAPDGRGELTQYSPEHHKHQTGIYWGLKEVNGRDYFMNWREDHWRRISAEALDPRGMEVRWRTVYELLDSGSNAVLRETQTWSFAEEEGRFIIDLEWQGEAKTDVTVGKFYVGGLFVRMPWHEGVEGDAINAAGERNGEAEGRRSIWLDLGIVVPGRSNKAHIAILDHPDNKAFPTPWRVDSQLGVGPSRQILGEWRLARGENATMRYRLVVYTGDHDAELIGNYWKKYVCGE